MSALDLLDKTPVLDIKPCESCISPTLLECISAKLHVIELTLIPFRFCYILTDVTVRQRATPVYLAGAELFPWSTLCLSDSAVVRSPGLEHNWRSCQAGPFLLPQW